MMPWQPIETAPKDGRVVLVANPESGTWLAKYMPVYQSGYKPTNPWSSMLLNHDHLNRNGSWRPTHWMPLPEPPSE